MTQSRHAKMMARFADNKKALEAVLKQQAEPSQWRDMVVVSLVREGIDKHKARELADHFAAPPQQQAEALQAMNDQLTTGTSIMLDGKRVDPASVYKQAEPVAWMDREGDLYKMPEIPEWAPPHTMLYTTPPQRQWVGLTDEDFLEACQIAERGNYLLAFQRIQIKLKEKNSD